MDGGVERSARRTILEIRMFMHRSQRFGATLAATSAVVVATASLIALAAFAQPAAEPKKEEPKSIPATPIEVKPETNEAPKGGRPMAQGPDGKEYPVISNSTICIEIEDLKIGDGKEVAAGSTITIHYHGTLASNGKMFDSTRGKEPATFPLQRLITGWQAGIPGMKVGGIRILRIPYQLAYGEREIPGPDGTPLIPAKSDLVFSIEVKDVK